MSGHGVNGALQVRSHATTDTARNCGQVGEGYCTCPPGSRLPNHPDVPVRHHRADASDPNGVYTRLFCWCCHQIPAGEVQQRSLMLTHPVDATPRHVREVAGRGGAGEAGRMRRSWCRGWPATTTRRRPGRTTATSAGRVWTCRMARFVTMWRPAFWSPSSRKSRLFR